MSMTSNIQRDSAGRITTVRGKPCPDHLKVRIPPAWTNVRVDTDPEARCIVMGTDAAGRTQRMYSADHVASASSAKFERVRQLIEEMDDIRTQIESDLNDPTVQGRRREAALVAYLIFETGVRPGSSKDAMAKVQAYGATTLQLRHVKPCARGVRLKFVGKKGVAQNVLVTNPYLVQEIMDRKAETPSWSHPLFHVKSLSAYFRELGTGDYTPKDFRTMRGTKVAMDLMGKRKRLPSQKGKRKKLLNLILDKVAGHLGNTRAVARTSYVDPAVLECFYLN
jgi:DNA topoisomerase-1